MTYTIREADEEDVAFIVELFRLPHASAVLNETSEEMVQAALDDPNNEEYIIEEDGDPVGYFHIKNHEWLVELGLLIAREPGRGMGRFALEWGLRHAFDELRAHRVVAEIRESNTNTRALVERLGLRAEGVYRDGFRDEITGAYENLLPYGILEAEYRACVS
ncbi:MAG: GNAT family N-acetyltransferase [Vulcanimicrobiaceae bacterium]